jgi:ATP-binding cassette subfamily B protein
MRGGPGARFAGEKPKPKDTRKTLLRIWNYVRTQRLALAACVVMLLVVVACGLLGPYLLTRAIDDEILDGDMVGLTRIALYMLAAYATSALLMWLQTYIITAVAQETVREIRQDLFDKVQTLPVKVFDQRSHGDLMSRLTNDIENINLVLTQSLSQLVTGVLTAAGVVVVMLILNWLLAVVILCVMLALTYGVNRFVANRTRAGFRAQQASLGKLNGLIEETIGGQRVVIAHNRQGTVVGEFAGSNVELRAASIQAQTFSGYVGPLMNLINNFSLIVVAAFGGYLAINGRATIGTIAGFINYTRQFGRPLNELANTYNTFQAAIAGAERVFEILDEAPDADAVDAQPVERFKGEVVFENVGFAYDPDVPVLKDVSIHALPGQVVALVGPTGAGKTTIVNLLSGFYEASEGRIFIDGIEFGKMLKHDVRRQMGVVLQDTYLFSGTVMENIRYGRLEASDAEVFAAAELANADQFIQRLPHGYETPLNERAANLSQGQRQLLAIARAILADPAILILDEATSSVDTRTEKIIQSAMLRLMEGRTSFVIAHRLSTIRKADQILVVNGGRIVERGTHEELLEARGFYHGLYDSQFQHRSVTVAAD